MLLNQNTLYQNRGNESVLHYIGSSDRLILDVGCGAGDTGGLIKSIYPDSKIIGITCSQKEHKIAEQILDQCIYTNVETDDFSGFPKAHFDVICFSHILEHLIDPTETIRKLLPYLKPNGKIIIALPNIAHWRERWKLTLGKFEYTDSGVMDKTHLHFYTFYTAPKYLIDPIRELKIENHLVNGSVPLAFFRHHLLTTAMKKWIDRLGAKYMPNLFGGEIFIIARYLPNL